MILMSLFQLKLVIEGNKKNAILIKMNQIGTLTETMEAVAMAKQAGYKTIMSHRTGETEEAPDLAALRRRLEPRVFALRLRDETRLRTDVWARAGEDSLRGVFLRMLRDRYDSARTDAEREQITRAARWGLAALDGREEAEPLW